MKYLIGKEKDFYDFLDGIIPKDNVAIISHIDLDGITSALLVKEILGSKKIKVKAMKFIEYGSGMFVKVLREFKKKKITNCLMGILFQAAEPSSGHW